MVPLPFVRWGGTRVEFVNLDSIQQQRSGNLLWFNGHVGIAEGRRDKEIVRVNISHDSDNVVASRGSLEKQLNECQDAFAIVQSLLKLIGGWSVVYFRDDLKLLIVGRDIFGRKSLLWCPDGDNNILFSQVIFNSKDFCSEIPPGSICLLHASGNIWEHMTVYSMCKTDRIVWVGRFDRITHVSVDEKSADLQSIRADYEMLVDDNASITSELILRLCEAVKFCCCDVNSNDSIAILFSGGVDSLLVAICAAKTLPPNILIDLINVSFCEKDYSLAPDRSQSIDAYLFLKSTFAFRQFRLILVDVGCDELYACRKASIASAIAPSSTVLDDSIGCVLWFAARGQGRQFVMHGFGCEMKTSATVVLVGSGADELFGGYSVHRSSFEREGRFRTIALIEHDLRRIGERNCGRDDRVTSSVGKQLHAPFLLDNFAAWINGLPLEIKSDFTEGRGIGEKKLLRGALQVLGAPNSLFSARKRAMQFGSRIARRIEKGSDYCDRLKLL